MRDTGRRRPTPLPRCAPCPAWRWRALYPLPSEGTRRTPWASHRLSASEWRGGESRLNPPQAPARCAKAPVLIWIWAPRVALYGSHYPDPSCEGLDGVGLRPVMALKTRVARSYVPAGTPAIWRLYPCAGAGRRAGRPTNRLCRRPARLMLRPAGGTHPRTAGAYCGLCLHGHVHGGCHRAGAAPGDEVELFGEHLPVEDTAALAGTIQYELLCAVSPGAPGVLELSVRSHGGPAGHTMVRGGMPAQRGGERRGLPVFETLCINSAAPWENHS